MHFFEKLKNTIVRNLFKKRNVWILVFFGILATWGGIRSCSHEDTLRKKLYFIGRDSTWYPEELMGKERKLQAFTNDLLAAITEETKLQFEWLETNSVALIEGLNAGNYDAVLTAMRPNFINQNKYVFSELLFQLGPVLIVGEESSATSLKDMQGKTLAIPKGSNLVFNTIKKGGANAYNIFIINYDNINKALEALEKNQMDGIIMNTIPAYAQLEGFYAGRLKVITPPLTDEGIRLVGLRDEVSEELIADFDKALTELKKNGTYDRLITKWNLINPEIQYMKKQKQ